MDDTLQGLVDGVQSIDMNCWGGPVTVEIYSMEAPRQVDLVLYIQVKLKDSIKEECEALWIRSAREIMKLREQLDNLKTPQKGDFDKTNIDQL